MQRSGGYWNQHSGHTGEVVSDLLGALGAQETRSSLGHLKGRLAALKASDVSPRVVKNQRRRPRRPGWVVDAVVRVMAEQEERMRVAQVHAAVEALLGAAVSKDSVSWCLSVGVRRKGRRFVRVARDVLASRSA
jgi:hypothetical protein